MTRGRVLLSLVLLVVTLVGLVQAEGIERDWLPMLLVSIGGAVLALSVSYAIGRRATTR